MFQISNYIIKVQSTIRNRKNLGITHINNITKSFLSLKIEEKKTKKPVKVYKKMCKNSEFNNKKSGLGKINECAQPTRSLGTLTRKLSKLSCKH